MAGILINNLIKEENIATQRSPLDYAIFAQIQQAAHMSNNLDLDHSLLLDIVTLSCYIGPCVSEYAQTTQLKINYHIYPSDDSFECAGERGLVSEVELAFCCIEKGKIVCNGGFNNLTFRRVDVIIYLQLGCLCSFFQIQPELILLI